MTERMPERVRRGGRPGQAGPLDRDRIVRAALRVVERGGVATLSMRKVADEIGTAPMSLYRHVADRRALLLELLATAAAQLPVRPLVVGVEPRQRLTAFVRDVRRALRDSRWVAEAILDLGEIPAPMLAFSDGLLATLYDAGMDERTAAQAHLVLWQYIWGNVTFGHLGTITARAYDRRGEQVVGSVALARTVPAMRELDTEAAFDAGLIAIVDGLLAGSTPAASA